MKRHILIINLFLLLQSQSISINAGAKPVRFTATTPATVSVGQQFRLQYTVNTVQVSHQPSLSQEPSQSSAFDIIYGPAVSTSQSVQIINGRKSENASTTFTYTLIARSEGTFTLPAATVTADGRTVTSNRPVIRVLKRGTGGQPPVAPQRGASPSGAARQSSAPHRGAAGGRTPSPDDLYIQVTSNKKTVYEQEPVLLSYQVYTNLNLEQLQGKMPDLNGFVAKEIQLPRQKRLTPVNHNGHVTQTTLWSQYLMFPQKSGTLTVPSIPFEGTVAYVNYNVDPIDAFFAGTSPIERVSHTVQAPPLDIEVKPLPPKPAGFSGAVGNNFTISAALATPYPRQNETLTLSVKIQGTGNIDLIAPPEVQFPADFEILNNKPLADTRLTPAGQEGTLTIEYYAIPNHQGQYVIPPVKFTYFSPADGQYHTVTTAKSITVTVAKGTPNSYAARQRLKDNDIRDIHKTSRDHPRSLLEEGSGGAGLVLAYAGLAVLFLIAYRAKSSQTSAPRWGATGGRGSLRRVRSPRRVANARLKTARQLMTGSEACPDFYREIQSTLRTFVADKFALQPAQINQDSIAATFAAHSVSQELTTRYLRLLSHCEESIYGQAQTENREKRTENSPLPTPLLKEGSGVVSGWEEAMHTTYAEAEDLIDKLKKVKAPSSPPSSRRGRKPLSPFTLLFTLFSFSFSLIYAAPHWGATGDFGRGWEAARQADSLYAHHHYAEAARAYTQLLQATNSAPHWGATGGLLQSQLLYNLGNSYYRLKDIPHAILAYERAARLNPSDDDVRHNLTLARAQTQDKLYTPSDLGIAPSFNSLLNTFGVAGWLWLAVAAFALMLASILAMRYSSSPKARKTAFALTLATLILFLTFNLFALIQHNKLTDHSAAIVLKTTKLMTTPDTTATNQFTIHPGTKLHLQDTTLPEWSEVTLSDGRKGWVNNSTIETI